jgi:hypothetical protein
MFLRNVGPYMSHTTSYPRRQNSSYFKQFLPFICLQTKQMPLRPRPPRHVSNPTTLASFCFWLSVPLTCVCALAQLMFSI